MTDREDMVALADELKAFLDRSTMNDGADKFLRKVEAALRSAARTGPDVVVLREAFERVADRAARAARTQPASNVIRREIMALADRALSQPEAVEAVKLPVSAHWLGDRESASNTKHAADERGCVLYFADQEDCVAFMRMLTVGRPPRAETAERERDEAREARWNTFAKMPEPGRKFIALYNDGSGAAMFFAFDGGVIDSDGDEYYDWNPDDTSYDRWAYLPDSLEFWCEIRAEDPVSLRAARAVMED